MWQASSFILCVLLLSVESFLGPQLRIKQVPADGDVGEPLFLSSLIREGRIPEAQNAALVSVPGTGDIRSYAGYLTVDEEYNSNLWFWFFPSRNNYETDPVLLWLNGGPGTTSLLGLFQENGPFEIVDNQLRERQYSWNLNHSVVYFDNPVGTGFSFTESDLGYAVDEEDVSRNLYSALLQFFLLFPEIEDNDFYLTGESYGGHYVPALGRRIHDSNVDAIQKINLVGIAIGNGWTDPINQVNYSSYLYELGLFDSATRDDVQAQEDQLRSFLSNEQWDYANALLYLFNQTLLNITGFSNSYNYLIPSYFDYVPSVIDDYVNLPDVRLGLHVGNRTFLDGWTAYNYIISDLPRSYASDVEVLLDNYRVLLYNGQLDITCGYPMMIDYVKNLRFSASEEYSTAQRTIWRVGSDIAGYVKRAGNLYEVLVRNAGHLVPKDQPEWALDLITRFVADTLQ